MGSHIRHLMWKALRNFKPQIWPEPISETEKGVIAKGVFSLEESLKSLNSLESLEMVGFSFVFQSGDCRRISRISKFSRISRMDFSEKTPFPKDPFFRTRISRDAKKCLFLKAPRRLVI